MVLEKGIAIKVLFLLLLLAVVYVFNLKMRYDLSYRAFSIDNA